MDYKIRRKLSVGDIGSIINLHGVLYAKEHGYDHTFEAYVAEPLAQFSKRTNKRERIWIVEKDEKILGAIALCEVSKNEGQLRWFLMSPELRGRGIGKKLMESLIDFAQEQNYQFISLWTVKGLEAAKNLYLSCGFTLSREVEHIVWGGNHTEQEYTLALKVTEDVAAIAPEYKKN